MLRLFLFNFVWGDISLVSLIDHDAVAADVLLVEILVAT
jgi:hypothetical protein